MSPAHRVFLTGGSGFIGTNLVAKMLELGHEVCNFDQRAPLVADHAAHWQRGDILDAAALGAAMRTFAPDRVVHLAARTDRGVGTTVEAGFRANTIGTANLLAAVRECGGVERLLVTSSQFVCGPGRLPESDDDFFPHTVYGQSKVETERLTRAAALECTWTIVRPVNIWGPYHERYCREFWKIASLGLYLHPDVPAPMRSYGYVGNVVWQITGLLDAPPEAVDQRVFYLGDRPLRIDRWSQGFNRAFRGREAPRLPVRVLKALALIGDAISSLTRRPFIITTSRLQSMTEDYLAPMDPIFDLLGDPPWSLDDGIRETVEWYRGVSN